MVSGIMQFEEKCLNQKQSILYLKMRKFNPANIDESILHLVDDNMEIFNDALSKLIEGIKILLLTQSDSLSTERVKEWKNVQTAAERDSIEYRKRVNQRAEAVKETLMPRSSPSLTQSQVTTACYRMNS